MYDIFFLNLSSVPLKNAWLHPIFVLHFNSPCGDVLVSHSDRPGKNTIVLVGTILKRNPSFWDLDLMCRTYAA